MKSPTSSILRALLLSVVGGGVLAGCAVYPVHPLGHGHGYAGYRPGRHGYGGGWAGHGRAGWR